MAVVQQMLNYKPEVAQKTTEELDAFSRAPGLDEWKIYGCEKKKKKKKKRTGKMTKAFGHLDRVPCAGGHGTTGTVALVEIGQEDGLKK